LPPCDSHAGIVANKKRIASYFLDAPELSVDWCSKSDPFPF
jgi:hypothetical protein